MNRQLRDGLLGFIWFTLTLTPYMLLVVDTDTRQYAAWVAMQAVLVPPLSVGYAWLTRRFDRPRTKEPSEVPPSD